MRFDGQLTQRFDGHNTTGDGTMYDLGPMKSVRVDFGATPHGSEYRVDGKELDPESSLHQLLDDYFTDLWPDDDGDWDAEVRDGVVTAVVPVRDGV